VSEKSKIREFINTEERDMINNGYPKVNLNNNIEKGEASCKALINRYLDDYFLFLDIGINLVIQIHRICENTENSELVFTTITAKLSKQLISIRKLLYAGMMDAVKCIFRSFNETTQIFFACLDDIEFAKGYGTKDELYDNNKFWFHQIKGGKINKYLEDLFIKVDIDKNIIFSLFKNNDKFLSDSVHGSFNSTFSSYMMPTIDGVFTTNLYGTITSAYPNCMFNLFKHIFILSNVFYQSVENSIAQGFDISYIKSQNKYLHYYYLYNDVYKKFIDEIGTDVVNINKKLVTLYTLFKAEEEKEKMGESEQM
jgi:hypothetical protein